MYKFTKRSALRELDAQGSESILTFTCPNEKAVVKLDAEGNITEVFHTDLKENKENIIRFSDSKHVVVGDKNCQRDVYHFLKPTNEEHLQLRLGLTVHSGYGTWSSLPHDFEENLESGFEEIFFYIVQGGSKRGYQIGRGVWMDGLAVDDIWPIEDRTFSTVPMGYHPVVGEPGVKIKYVWGYLAKFRRWEKI